MSNSRITMNNELPKEWQVVRLGDILSLEYGKGLPANERTTGNYPVFGSNGIVGYHEKFLVKGPGIVVGRKGTIGAVTWVDSDFWPIDTTYFVKTKNENVFLKWLFFKLKQSNLPRLSQSDVVPGLKRELVYHITIPLPPLPEQRRIAEVLGTLDSAIEKVGGAIEKTERLKRGLMQRLLTRGIGHERFKESELGRVPEEWEAVKLEDIGTLQYGFTASAKNDNTGVKFLRITDITDNGIDWSNIPYCELSESELKKYELNKGDVLFARIGSTTGKTCYIDRYLKGVFASYLIRFQPLAEDIDTKFLYYYTHSQFYWSQINKNKEAHLKKGINAKVLGSLLIPLPPLPEQRRIAEILSAADAKLELERKRKEKLERIKKGLMNDLLTGRKRVKIEV